MNMNKIIKKSFERITQKVAVFILCVALAGSFYSCDKSTESGGECHCEKDETILSSSQDFYRYVNNEKGIFEKQYFEISSNKVIVNVGKKMTENDVENSFRKNTLLQMCDISASGNREFQFLVCFNNTDRNAMKQLVNQWKSNDTILFVGHVIIDETGRKTAALTNQISVRLKDNKDFPILQKALVSYDISKVEQDEFDNRTYLLIVNYSSEKSALQIANELHETGLFEYASPNLLLFIRYLFSINTI